MAHRRRATRPKQSNQPTLDLYYNLLLPDRQVGEFFMADTTLKVIGRLRTARGDLLWAVEPGEGSALAFAAPETLFGRQVWSDPDLPPMSPGATSVTFADMGSAYVIRDIGRRGPQASERPAATFGVAD